MSYGERVAATLSWLLNESHLMPPEGLPGAVDEALQRLGAAGCRVHLISRDQRTLVLLRAADEGGPEAGRHGGADELPVEGTLPGRAFRDAELMTSSDGTRVWVPLVDGVERLGLLEVLLSPGSADLGLELAAAVRPLSALVAELVVSKGQYTDSYERARRALPMGVAAELLWRQLPPLTFATERFVVTAQLEPWNEVGGDAFDYSIDGDTLHLAVFDGMGHGLGATLLTGVALAAYRNARRLGAGLVETAATVDRVLSAQFGDDSFVTAVLAELDLGTGTIRTLCAAHPAPLLVRDGRALGELDTEPGVPLGLGDRDDTVLEAQLQPGDRILMFSDGVVEARSGDGAFLGIDRLVDLLVRQESRQQTPPETLRRLALAVLEHQQDTLQDDATLLMLEWAGDSYALVPESVRTGSEESEDGPRSAAGWAAASWAHGVRWTRRGLVGAPRLLHALVTRDGR